MMITSCPVQGRVLVGRDRETRVLKDALAAAARSERAVVVITGEPGIGKTRLLEELVTHTVAAGGVACWGRTWEVGQTPPFHPWIEVLAALEVPGDRAPAFGSLAPQADRALRLEHFSQVVAFIGRRARHAPLTLLFDDLHASDSSSLELLDYALPRLSGKRVLVALAARDADATRSVALALGRIQRGAYRLPLARLDEAEVRALVGERADSRRVYELSEGNPLFVEELVLAQRTRGGLGLPPVSSVRGLLRERVARLPELTQRALLAAALIGRDFRGRVVADMLGATSLGALLEPATEIGLIFSMAPDSHRFSHALVAEALADELDAATRAEWHIAAARALERRAPEDASAIAHHLLSAGEQASAAAVTAAQRAAELCMQQLAFEDAASFYRRALESLAAAAPDDLQRRVLLLTARAEALQHATQPALAATLCDEAAALVRARPGMPEGRLWFARIALVRGLEFRFGHTDPLLVAFLTEALERLGAEPLALRAQLLARLAAAEQPSPTPLATVTRALEAIQLAQQLEPLDRLEVTYVATSALVDYVRPDVLEPILEDTLRLSRGVNRSISAHTRLRLCFSALTALDRPSFATRMQAFLTEADALGLSRWQRHVPMLEALIALLEGRFDDEERAIARFESLSEQMGDTGAQFLVDVHRAVQAWARTTPLDAGVRVRLGAYASARAAIAAWFACHDGSREAAVAALAQLGSTFPEDPDLAAMVAAAIALVGDRDWAERAYAALLPKSGEIALTAVVGFAVMDLNDRVLLALATVTERWDAVEVHAEAALRVAGKLGSPVWQARVQADFADALERRDRESDREAVQRLRAEARRSAESLGMSGIVTRCTPAAPARLDRPHSTSTELTCTRQGALWVVSGWGESVYVKDSRGMQMIARLVAEPATPLHALDLAGASAPIDGGDAGPALDDRARREYRTRLRELVAERDEAESFDDAGRTARANIEIDALSAELERAYGLGGRERRIGAASERARTNVQRRIAHALEQIRAGSPNLGAYLVASLRTGTYCVYEPAPRLTAPQ